MQAHMMAINYSFHKSVPWSVNLAFDLAHVLEIYLSYFHIPTTMCKCVCSHPTLGLTEVLALAVVIEQIVKNANIIT